MVIPPTSFTASSAPAQPRLLSALFVRVLVVELGAMSGFYLLLAVVPMHASANGAGGLGAGLTTAVLMFASVAGALSAPRTAARVGYRRLLIGGLVLLGAPALLLPWTAGLGAMLLVATVRGLGFAIVVTAVGALSVTTLHPGRRGEGLGVLGVVAMVPAVTALPAGVWVVEALGFTVAFLLGALMVLMVVPVTLGLPRVVATSEPDTETGLVSMARRPGTLGPAVVFAVAAIASGSVVTFLPGAVSGNHGLATAALFVQALAATITRYLGGRSSDRHGPHRLVVPGVLLVAGGMGASALTGSPGAVLAGMVVFGAGFGLVQTASLNLMLDAATPAQYGAVSAAWNLAYDVGWGVGAAAVGVLVTSVGFPLAFAATAAATLAMLPTARRISVADPTVDIGRCSTTIDAERPSRT